MIQLELTMKVMYTVWLGLLSMEIGRYANSNIMEFSFITALLDTKISFHHTAQVTAVFDTEIDS